MSNFFVRVALVLTTSLVCSAALAQSPAPQPAAPVNPAAQMSPLEYGAMISNANAKKAAAAALAEAQKMNVPMIVAITDTSGNVLYLERMDAAIAEREAALNRRNGHAHVDVGRNISCSHPRSLGAGKTNQDRTNGSA